MVDRGSSSSWKWATTSSRETRRRSATFQSPGAAVVEATPGKADTRAAPGSKCYRLPKLPISVRWPWVPHQVPFHGVDPLAVLAGLLHPVQHVLEALLGLEGGLLRGDDHGEVS